MRKIDNYEDKENKFDSSYLTLLSICVSPEYKGKGLAMQLVEDFEKRLINNGYNGYTLTVHKTNSRANKFYRKLFMSIYKETKNEYGYIKRLT